MTSRSWNGVAVGYMAANSALIGEYQFRMLETRIRNRVAVEVRKRFVEDGEAFYLFPAVQCGID